MVIKKQLFQFIMITVLSYGLLISSANAQTDPVMVTVSGNKAQVIIELPGNISADITLSFENAVGLTAENLGITAELIDVTNFNLLSRLPGGLLNTIPVAFPVMITVEPLANRGLSFSGVVTFDIHTHNLEYTTNTPLRLFKAPLGGQFKDITMSTGSGSYRARGTTGKFSQFIITTDLRNRLTVANSKLNGLQNELFSAQMEIETTVYGLLSAKLTEIASQIAGRNYASASTRLSEFNLLVEQASGEAIPNVWRSSRDVNNVAGELIAQANSLRYSLHLLN